MPYFEKLEYKLHVKDFALAEMNLYSGEVKLKEAENQRLRLTIAEKNNEIEIGSKLLKAETARADGNKKEAEEYKIKFEKSKKGSRFWRVCTIVVVACSGTYIGVEQLK